MKQADRCPNCDVELQFKVDVDGQIVEILHPQPPCDGFRQFVERLVKRHRKGLN